MVLWAREVNVIIVSYMGLSVEITERDRFFTVYDTAGKPRGTIIRRSMYSKDKRWTVFNTDGHQLYATDLSTFKIMLKAITKL